MRRLGTRAVINFGSGPINLAGSIQPVAGGSPVRSITRSGVSFTGGSYSLANLIQRNASTADQVRNFTEVIVFDVLSNAATDAIASEGTSPTDGGPTMLLQNNSGALRVYTNPAGSYTALGSVAVGDRVVYVRRYREAGSYPVEHWINGRLIATTTGWLGAGSRTTYLGTGFPATGTNSRIVAYRLDQPAYWSDAEIRAVSANPWSMFEAMPHIGTYVDVASGGSVDHTLTTGGSFTLSGNINLLKERTMSAGGQLALTGTAAFASTSQYTLTAGGIVTFVGGASMLKQKILSPSGQVSLGGSASLAFIPAGGVVSAAPRNLFIGVGQKSRLS